MRRLALVFLLAAPLAAEEAVTAALRPVAGTNGGSGPFAYYAPVRVQLSDKPPEALSKEPKYASQQPLYGAIKLGNAPDSIVTFVLDEPEVGKTSALYVDVNNDNDLTNDGGGEWKTSGTTFIKDVEVTVHYAIEGKDVTEPYAMRFYRFKSFEKREQLRDKVLCYRVNHHEGKVTLAGREYRVCVADDNSDGRFDDLDKGALAIDLDGDGQLQGGTDSAEGFKLSDPFNANGTSWKVQSVTPQGDAITFVPAGVEVPAKPYIDPGHPALLFKVTATDGTEIDLEKLKGRVVLLDFWASW